MCYRQRSVPHGVSTLVHDGKARILECTLTGELAAKSGMICGGRLRVLIEALFP
jgi:xanthine/CO dehydrogenase XdhC/CoxF family maturation factor